MNKFISYMRPALSGQTNSIPVLHYPLKFRRHINSQKELYEACIEWVQLNLKFPAYRVRNTYPALLKAYNLSEDFQQKDLPDLLIALENGKTGYIVLQYKQKFLTLEQENFRDFLKSEGHQWAVCRSVEDFVQTLKKWGITSKYNQKEIQFHSESNTLKIIKNS